MNNITIFKQSYDRFLKALRYIIENEAKLKQDEKRWAKIKSNFFDKFEAPLDAAWQALSKEEQKSLSSIYLHRRIQTEPIVKKVLETFGGKIVSVIEGDKDATNPT